MLNKLVLRVLLSLTIAVSFVGLANATLITQEFISDATGDVIGSITINTEPSEDAGFGLKNVFIWEEFEFFGLDMQPPSLADGSQFYASFDSFDFSLGIQDLQFDLNDVFDLYAWNGAAFGGFGGVDIFASPNGDPSFSGYIEFTLGQASIVPTPATLVLFLTAITALAARRKNS